MIRTLTTFALNLVLAAGSTTSFAAKTLVYCSEGSPEGFNPALYTAGTTFDASSRQIFNRLVEFERGSTKIVPALATSWETSDDGLEWTVTLREGVTFHDGTPFDADAVAICTSFAIVGWSGFLATIDAPR